MKRRMFFGAALFLMATGGAFGEATPTPKPSQRSANEMSSEQRKEMAIVHEKMAACLRSDKPLNNCRDEMRSNCRAIMGKQGCPMMQTGEMMGPGRGMKRRQGMMQGQGSVQP